MSRKRTAGAQRDGDAADNWAPGPAPAQKMHVEKGAGRVLVGPKKLKSGYARIVSNRDGSGRIESFNPASGTWCPAPESVSFTEVWCAPPAGVNIF
jgi:hypothetical protein